MTDFSNLPYKLHTGSELELMLNGVKPLAVFSNSYPGEPCEEVIPEIAFEPYVKSGRFEKREFIRLLNNPPSAMESRFKGYRHVLYVLPAESWRIDAYIEMDAQAEKLGWSEEFERRQGFLLGYEDWQTDAWLIFLLGRPQAKNIPWLQRLEAKQNNGQPPLAM